MWVTQRMNKNMMVTLSEGERGFFAQETQLYITCKILCLQWSITYFYS